MKLKSVFRLAGTVLTPACACLIITAGCTTESELSLPPGAYVPPPAKKIPPENSALSSEPEVIRPRAPRETVTFPKDSDEQVFTLEELSENRSAGPFAARTSAAPKKSGPVFAKDDIIYKIRKNDTLGGIAHRHGMTAPALAEYNGLSLKSKIYPGKTLHIPASAKTSSAAVSTAKTAAAAATATAAVAVPAGATVYVVRSGDTLGGIAQKHSVRTADLVAANDLDVRKPIRTGQKLIIPASAKKTTDAAKAEPAKKSAAKAEPAKKSTAATPAKAEPVKKSTAAAAKAEPAKAAPAAAKAEPAKTAAKAEPVKKSTAAAAKAEPAKAAAKAEPVKKSTAAAAKAEPSKAAAPAAEQKSADDLLKSIGTESAGKTEPAPAAAEAPAAAAPKSGSVSVAQPAREEVFDEDNTIVINIEREMTLEETAKAFDRSYTTVKKLNPAIPPDTRLKAGTAVKIPIF